ncbi:MAG: hypothetical protein NTX15_00555 [Candidatus Kapabacteria bacterium]|nr:hypothetical protein [Candidatus Kapabacteria bacterium]
MKTTSTIAVVVLTAVLSSSGLSGQFIERSFPCVPTDMRRIIAMDITSGIDPVVLGVGDGIVTTLAGEVFRDVTQDFASKIFDGVACISPQVGFASTDDGIIVGLSITERSEGMFSGFPTKGRSLIRCGQYAFAIRDGGVIRMYLAGDKIVVDTVLSIGQDVQFISSSSAKAFAAYSRATQEVLLVSASSRTILARSQLDRHPAMLQALSDSVVAILVSDTLIVGDTEIPRRPLKALWLYSGKSKDLYGYDARPSETPVARFAASFLGGGAVVVPPGANNKSNAMIYYARGSAIDSVVKPATSMPYFRNATAGVAWWYKSTSAPVWTFSGGTVSTAEVDTGGNTITFGDKFQEHPTFSNGTWNSARAEGDSLIVTFATIEIPGQNTASNWVVGWSVDKGFSWLQRPAPVRFARWDIDENGRIIAATDTKIVKTSIYTSGVTTILDHEGRMQIGAVHIHGDTLLVVSSDSLMRSTDGGDTWTVTFPEGFSPGVDVFSIGRALVLQGKVSSITTDCGSTWRSFSLRTSAAIASCVLLSDTSVLGSWDDAGIHAISRSDGRLTSVNSHGVLGMFDGDLVFYGTSTGMRAYNSSLSRLESDTTFRLDPYQRSSQWNVDRYETKERFAFGNDDEDVYFILGDRMKRISKTGATSVASETKTDNGFVFPNPTTSTLTAPSGIVAVRTILGDIVWNAEGAITPTIDVSRWQSGTYIVETNVGRQLVIVSR